MNTVNSYNLGNRQKGFTLIEIMVAISIVTILATLGLVTYSSARQGSRDQERVRELMTIKQALELYRSDERYYPATLPAAGSALYSTDGYKKYLEAVPEDPSSGRIYKYQALPPDCDNGATNPCSGFIVCAAKERSGDFYPQAGCSASPPSPCGSVSCNMGLSSD